MNASCAFAAPLFALLVGLMVVDQATAGVVIVAQEAEYLAPLVDRMVNRTKQHGAHIGTVAGQTVVIPDLEIPLDETLARIAALAESTDCRTVLAIVPGLALSTTAKPGDLLIASRIYGSDGEATVNAERDFADALRLAGADAGFFEVPPTQAGSVGGQAPRVIVGSVASVAQTGSTEAAERVGRSRGADAIDATRGHATARALSATSLRWAIVAPMVGAVGHGAESQLEERAVDNVVRLVTSYLKAIPPEEPKLPSIGVPRLPSKGSIGLREGPSPSAYITGTFPRGSRYQVVETTPDEKWNRVRLADGREGWVMGTTLEREPLLVYGLEIRDGRDVLFPRDYDVSTHDATAEFIARALCKPDEPRLLTPRGHEGLPYCAGIDSFELVVDTINVFLGPKSKAYFSSANAAESERFLAKLVYSLTDIDRIKIVRLRFVGADAPFVPRLLRREDFLAYWPAADLERAASESSDPATRQRAAALLDERRH